MNNIFDKTTRKEIIQRIKNVSAESQRQWGKMNVYQMLKHCSGWDEWVLVETIYKQNFMGWIFGKMVLKGVLKDDAPLARNTPTIPELKIKETSGDIESAKAKWIGLIEQYENFRKKEFVHVFFGKMTKDQLGQLAYKHADHHLRQFNC